MISDTLNDARHEIIEYLLDPENGYQEDVQLYERIIRCIDEMAAISAVLDTPPGQTPLTPEALYQSSIEQGLTVYDWKNKEWIIGRDDDPGIRNTDSIN